MLPIKDLMQVMKQWHQFLKINFAERENDVIPDKNERDRLKKCLQDRPYSKLILKCYQLTGYYLL